jgi:hypothetical protein
VGRINCFEWKILASLAFLLQCECVLDICMYQCQGSLFGRYCVLCCVESGLLLSSFSISYLWFASRMLRYLHMVSPASWFLVVLVVLTFSACLYHAVNSLEWDVNRLMITVDNCRIALHAIWPPMPLSQFVFHLLPHCFELRWSTSSVNARTGFYSYRTEIHICP